MSKTYSKTRILVECALMIAIGTVLSNIKIFTMPNGGSVTLLSMLPFVLVSFRHGVKWGLFTGLVNGCLQMLLGFWAPPTPTFIYFLGEVLLDYLVAFMALGMAELFARPFKNRMVGVAVGTFIEAGARKLTRYAKRRWREHPARKVAKWERKDIKARANVDFQKMASEHPELASNPLSRVQQKWKLKRRYSKEAKAAAKQGAKAAKKTAAASGTATRRAAQFVTRHPVAVLVLLLLLLLCFLVSAVSSIFPTLGSGLANALSGTSYASEDTDLLGVDEDYTALENELAQTVANIESTHPGYDEYRYSVDEIGHNPYELASYLSAKYHVYFREQVQDELREIFEAQYELTLTEEVEIRYRTETSTDPETGETTTEEVPYEYYILNVTLTNKTLPAVILPRLDEQQREIYTVMQQLKGNKPYLWEGIYNGGEDTGPSYEIPGEALDDPTFAALMEEATKYIGWPYVWGGSSPSTSFDCSGFVCWVYTASGVHNLPRTTAQGIYNQCAIISPSEAKPGDIIFFTGTYDSPGPVSHVGIYVGGGMMLHCGSPIQYANINSSYWQTHFYAFGRL